MVEGRYGPEALTSAAMQIAITFAPIMSSILGGKESFIRIIIAKLFDYSSLSTRLLIWNRIVYSVIKEARELMVGSPAI
jgi:hypothetical protein